MCDDFVSRAATLCAAFGVWRSLVARSVRVGEVPSSNLGTPIGRGGTQWFPRVVAYAVAAAWTLARRRVVAAVRNVIAIATMATPTPHQTPLMLSSHPIARSSENRPGPIAVTDTA